MQLSSSLAFIHHISPRYKTSYTANHGRCAVFCDKNLINSVNETRSAGKALFWVDTVDNIGQVINHVRLSPIPNRRVLSSGPLPRLPRDFCAWPRSLAALKARRPIRHVKRHPQCSLNTTSLPCSHACMRAIATKYGHFYIPLVFELEGRGIPWRGQSWITFSPYCSYREYAAFIILLLAYN